MYTSVKRKYLGVIFDLDGVLCSTDEYHFTAWRTIAEKIGIHNYNREDNNRQRGVSRMESLDILLEKSGRTFTQSEKQQLADEKNSIYRSLLGEMSICDLNSDVKDTLDTLRKNGILLAVGSSSKNTSLILGRIGLGDYFDAIADGNDITHSKPDPEVFLLAAKRLGLPPADCLVVEDAVSGIEAAVRGGFDAAAIGTAQMHGSAKYAVSSLTDLCDIARIN